MKESSIAAFAGPFFKIYDGNGNIKQDVSFVDISVNIEKI